MEESKFPKIVRLSIGGVHFTTSLDTLMQDKNSMLAAMFSGRHNVMTDEDGRYFMDRDGTHFRYILNYLRDGDAYIPSENSQLLDELYEEACFFQIDGLMQKLEQERNALTKTTKVDYITLVQMLNFSKGPLQAPSIKLNKMQLSYLDFSKCNLQNSDFSGIIAIEANFSSAKLNNCIFNDASLKNAILRDAEIRKGSFINANMNRVDMRGVKCRECNFYKAKLSGADLRDAELDESNLMEANFIVANLERASMFRCNLTSVNMDRANLKNVKGLQNQQRSV